MGITANGSATSREFGRRYFVIAGQSALKTRVNALMTRQSIRFERIFFDGCAGQARA
jgi:hypothetical protein